MLQRSNLGIREIVVKNYDVATFITEFFEFSCNYRCSLACAYFEDQYGALIRSERPLPREDMSPRIFSHWAGANVHNCQPHESVAANSEALTHIDGVQR